MSDILNNENSSSIKPNIPSFLLSMIFSRLNWTQWGMFRGDLVFQFGSIKGNVLDSSGRYGWCISGKYECQPEK